MSQKKNIGVDGYFPALNVAKPPLNLPQEWVVMGLAAVQGESID